MNTGQIVKSKTTNKFTTIPNEILRNKNLSLKEKGLLCYLLSLPDNWVLWKRNLSNELNEKQGTIDNVFRSLQEKGYILSVRVHSNNNGQFVGWNHIVYDIPTKLLDAQDTIYPTSTNPEVGK